ncbi:hypothetical protein K502DRAFT_354019, partial [Neoconidiobolus thromboides FSU 785]
MEQNEKSKRIQESFRLKAVERIEKIEKELAEFFSSINSIILAYPTNGFSGLIKSYLRWSKECLVTKKRLIELKNRPIECQLQREKHINVEAKFIAYFEKGISHYTQLIRNSQKL